MSNMKYKFLFIAAVILACLYGVIGLPTSKDQLVANWKKNIRLGLDLKGGSHLVIQMQLQDAFKSEADTAIQRMREDLAKAAIEFMNIDRNDPTTLQDADKIQINVTGVPATKSGNFRQLITENYG